MKYNSTPNKIIPFLFLFLFLVPGISTTSLDAAKTEKPEVGIEEQLGEFIPTGLSFKNSEGKTVQLKDFMDKPIVLSLVYFHCPTVCRPLLRAKVDVLDRLDLVAGKDYTPITVSFNEIETPENAKEIKDHFMGTSKKPISPKAWHFLTGDKETIKKLTDAVGFYYKRDGEDFIHPTGIIMISAKGKITRYFNGLAFLPFDVKLGLLEAGEGKVGPTISKILLFCFRYDPENKRYVFDILKVTATVTMFFLAIFILWLVISTRRKRKKQGQDNHDPKSTKPSPTPERSPEEWEPGDKT